VCSVAGRGALPVYSRHCSSTRFTGQCFAEISEKLGIVGISDNPSNFVAPFQYNEVRNEPPVSGAIADRPRTYKTRKKTAVHGILDGTTPSKYRRTVLNKTFVAMMTGLFSFVSSEAGIPSLGGMLPQPQTGKRRRAVMATLDNLRQMIQFEPSSSELMITQPNQIR
jgi:hypothetical protein